MKIILEQADLRQIRTTLEEYETTSDTERRYVDRLAIAIECILSGAKLEYRKEGE